MEAIRRLGRVQLSLGLAALGCVLLAPGEGMAQEALPERAEQHILQFRVSFGDSDSFMLYVLEGTPAYIGGQENGAPRLAVVPVLDHHDPMEVELRVTRSDASVPNAAIAPFESIRGRIGFPTYLVADRLIELEPVGVVTVERRNAPGISFKGDSSASLPEPEELGMCCITSGGVTTCGCAVSQGGQTCCAPQCCDLFK